MRRGDLYEMLAVVVWSAVTTIPVTTGEKVTVGSGCVGLSSAAWQVKARVYVPGGSAPNWYEYGGDEPATGSWAASGWFVSVDSAALLKSSGFATLPT